MPAAAAERPFPTYEIKYEWVHGTPDSNYDPANPVGDGCLRDPQAKVTHLPSFAFGAMIQPCDAVRTTIRFTSKLEPGQEGTIDFRWGTTWQYRKVSDPDANNNIWKPIENFTVDGKPYPAYEINNQDAVVVKDKSGNYVRMNSGKGYYEPVHFIFDRLFDDSEEHIFSYDAYLPIDADWGGLTWGTGSTGDTQGGSIGAKANGLEVYFAAGADFRHVKDSDYRAFLKISDETVSLPNRPLGTWGGELAGTTFTTEQCLEDRQLAPMNETITAKEIYPDLSYSTPISFQSRPGEFLMSRWPYEFMTSYIDNGFDSAKGLRVMNADAAGKLQSYELDRPGQANFSYKPTVESLVADIPGYAYVDNDLASYSDGSFDSLKSNGIPVFTAGKNVKLNYNKSGVKTQHFYYTYEPVHGTFALQKTTPDGEGLAGAKFELFRAVDMKEYLPATEGGYACKLPNITSLEQLQEVKVCSAENCQTLKAEQVKVPGGNADGTFTTDDAGAFAPHDENGTVLNDWLESGTYYYREVAAPKGYALDQTWRSFEVTEQGKIVQLTAVNTPETPENPPTPPADTPPTPPVDTPPTPSIVNPPAPQADTPPTPLSQSKELGNTGANLVFAALFAVALFTAGFAITYRRTGNRAE